MGARDVAFALCNLKNNSALACFLSKDGIMRVVTHGGKQNV